MPASKPIPREADGTVDIKQARKRMAGHRTNAEIEAKAKSEVRAKEPKRITVPKYLPQVMEAEYRLTAKKLVALHIFSDLDYDMLARYCIARAAWQNARWGRLVGAVGLAGAYGYDLGGLLLVALKREDVVNVDGVLRVYDVRGHHVEHLQLLVAEGELSHHACCLLT